MVEDYAENRKERTCAAAYSALSAKASKFFILNHRSMMFPLNYLHYSYLLNRPSLDLLSYNCLLFSLSRTPKPKGIMRREIWRRHFLLMYRQSTCMLTTALNVYYLFYHCYIFSSFNAFNPVSKKFRTETSTDV